MMSLVLLHTLVLVLFAVGTTAVNDLNYMTTNTYDVIEFTWSSFQVPCSANVFSLVCIRNGDSNTNVAVSEFSAVGVNVGFMCMYRYRQYGFQYNSVYECMLETSDMDLNDNVTVTTLPPEPGPPRELVAHAIDSNSFIITWSPPEVENYLTVYEVRLLRFSSRLFTDTTNSTVFVLPQPEVFLFAGMQYRVQVFARNSLLRSGPAANIDVTTRAAHTVPTGPTLTLPLLRSSTTLTITWSHTFSEFNAPQGFQITYQPLYSVAERVVVTTVNVMGEHVSDHTLTGLDSQLSYRVGVAAFNSEGSSSTEFENVPPSIAEPDRVSIMARRGILRFRFIGAGNCSNWRNRAGDIATSLFARLSNICPTCGYSPWNSYLNEDQVSVACSTNRDEIIFHGEAAFCGRNFRTCALNTHIEFFHSLDHPFILVSDTLLLVDSTCSLYTESSGSTNCFTAGAFSAGSLAGGVIGGIIAGALVAVVICVIVIFVIVPCVRKRRESGKEDDTPHPMTYKKPHKSDGEGANDRSAEKRGDYEFLPTFHSNTMQHEATATTSNLPEYDVPQDVLQGLPPAPPPDVEYEVPDVPDDPLPSANLKKKKKKPKTKGAKSDGSVGGAASKVPEKSASNPADATSSSAAQQQRGREKGGGRGAGPGNKAATAQPGLSLAASTSSTSVGKNAQATAKPGAGNKMPLKPSSGNKAKTLGSQASTSNAANLGGGGVVVGQQSEGKKKPLIPNFYTTAGAPGSGGMAEEEEPPKVSKKPVRKQQPPLAMNSNLAYTGQARYQPAEDVNYLPMR